MHNRARMTVASFLCKDLYVDWREGAWHFWDLLSDGEIANNAGNWQWVAGTGNDTRPNRVLNPLRQAERFDPEGDYVRRYLPELESVARQGDPPALAARRLRAARLPRADRRPRRGRRRVQSPPRVSVRPFSPLGRKRTTPHRIGAMGRLAVILGSNALGPGGEEIAAAAAEHGAAIVQRHGAGEAGYVLPHAIDHAANLRPLVEQGCDRVLAIGSVGSLKPELPVGSLVCPDDFVALHLGVSIFADARAHSRARLRPRAGAREVIDAWRAGGQAPRDGGVYWQTLGPRFETPAEIRLIAAARRRGRDDDRLRVHRRRRARPRLRGALRRRQPRQRARRGRARASPRSRTTASPTQPACATAWRRCCRSSARWAAEHGADGRPACAAARPADGAVGLRCEDGTIAALGPDVGGRARRRDDRRRRRPARRAAGQRPHPRGDDALPRQRRRPAADALAGREDLAGRGEARPTRTSTGAPGSPAPR